MMMVIMTKIKIMEPNIEECKILRIRERAEVNVEDQPRSPTNLTPGFRFATTRALLDRICFNRLKFFPQMIAGIALVVVGGHAAGS